MRKLSYVLTMLAAVAPVARAQSFATDDPVLQRIWEEGMERSHVDVLAQTLTDSLGPRLTGTPAMRAASTWAIAMYGSWGITARAENYGTWREWRRGLSHIDLVAPRERSLEGGVLAWSIGTRNGRPVEGDVVTLPEVPDSAAFAAWLPSVRGKYVAISFPPPTCRPDEEWEDYAEGLLKPSARFFGGPTRTAFHRMRAARAAADSAWRAREAATGYDGSALREALGAAGAAGILTTNWPGEYGVVRVFDARTETAPVYWLSCEDYGLVARLAERDQGPRVRASSTAAFGGETAAFNTIAEIPGGTKADEYVLLSAHFDSWDGGSGATDNGTGTVIMMEAMRILKAVLPNPTRTILVGHWNSEEQGLNGSRAFAADHPEIVAGLQAVFNQDNGTGRVAQVSASGLVGAGDALGRWFAQLPDQLASSAQLDLPGNPFFSGSDHAAFVCAGAPAVSLTTEPWDYFSATWHTNRDTFDKIALENVRENAVVVAMLAYLASEDPETTDRSRRALGVDRNGEPRAWPECRDGARAYNR